MTTLSEARAAVRRWLEDTSAAPLWSDAAIDDALTVALQRYGAFAPQEAQTTVTVAAGAETIAVAGVDDGRAVRRVLDPDGRVVPPAIGWRWWAGAIRLEDPAAAGTWTVEHTPPRLLPASAAGTMPTLAGDDAAVALLAAAEALRRRAAEEAKRNGPGGPALLDLATTWDVAGERLLRGRRRRVRGWVAG